MTHFYLDTAAQPFSQVAWDNKDILSCAPCIDLSPGTNRDVFINECALWWREQPDRPRVCVLSRYGAAFVPGQWLGPQTHAQYREQLLGGFSRLGSDAVWLDELSARFDAIKMRPDLLYLPTEDQAQVFELPNDHPTWAYVDALTGDARLPRNLRYTTRYGLTKIKSLAAWLQTRTAYVKQCWYAFFHPVQWGQMRRCYEQSLLADIPLCSWNQPNYSWSDLPYESDNRIGGVVHLPMYERTEEWYRKYDAILEQHAATTCVHLRPDVGDTTELLRIVDKYDPPYGLIFCDPTRWTQWKAGIGPMLDQIRAMREE